MRKGNGRVTEKGTRPKGQKKKQIILHAVAIPARQLALFLSECL